MAHELGHIEQGDGIRLMALRRLVSPLAFFLGLDRQGAPIGTLAGGRAAAQILQQEPDEKLLSRIEAYEVQLNASKLLGGFGIIMNAVRWADFWRQQDFEADEYARALGFGEELAQILEQYQAFDIAQPFLLVADPTPLNGWTYFGSEP